MRVNLMVNESLVQYVRPGLGAVIKPVGFGDRVLHGEVENVNQYAEPTGWRQANVKEYKAFVAIHDPPADLRSGMTAAVTVKCAEVPNALQVPVQAVYAHGDKVYCFVYDKGKWEARNVKAGPTNDKFFVIESGLDVGEQVAMNPRGYLAEVSLPKLSPEESQRAVPQPGRGPRGGQTAEAKGGRGKAEGGGAEKSGELSVESGESEASKQADVVRGSPNPAPATTEGLPPTDSGRPAVDPVARSGDRPQQTAAAQEQTDTTSGPQPSALSPSPAPSPQAPAPSAATSSQGAAE
jgi:hypothetical protein